MMDYIKENRWMLLLAALVVAAGVVGWTLAKHEVFHTAEPEPVHPVVELPTLSEPDMSVCGMVYAYYNGYEAGRIASALAAGAEPGPVDDQAVRHNWIADSTYAGIMGPRRAAGVYDTCIGILDDAIRSLQREAPLS